MAAAKKDVKKETGLALKHKKVSRRRARRAVPCLSGGARCVFAAARW
jgi:hypothetical protein